MANSYTRWYRTGTVSVMINSATVAGNGTHWASSGINPGDMFYCGTPSIPYEVETVDSDTQITLKTPYLGAGGSGKSYAVVRNFTATLPAQLAAQLAELMGKYELYIDTDMQKVTGLSAYEVAKQNGYKGTVAEWLESLKAGGELSTLLSVTEPLTYGGAGLHNALYRGKNLGNAFTEEQSAAIRAGTFKDIYVGDYWPITTTYTYTDSEGEEQTATVTVNWRVAALDYFLKSGDTSCDTHHAVIVPDSSLYSARMNPTNTTEGAYVGSEMYTQNLARAKALITAAFGEEHILKHRIYLQNAVKDGRPSGGAWFDSTIELMTEQMVYGGLAFNSGAPDGTTISNRYTVGCKQLNLFRHRPDLISNRQWFWL